MTDGIFIFTFNPIQPFISEARRTSDLYAGSKILVQLAKAAGDAIINLGGQLIYPTHLSEDVPNKLVARVPWDLVSDIAEQTDDALRQKWSVIAETARQSLIKLGPTVDVRWQTTWDRQIDNHWETYWAAVSIGADRNYSDAYTAASNALDAAKRSRTFESIQEPGRKDTLSGRRSALRTVELDASDYWAAVAKHTTAAKLRPDGRERLDAIGAVKRFSDVAQHSQSFPSTSSIASVDFANAAGPLLEPYKSTVESLLGDHLFVVQPNHPYWPYDGDLLYIEGLTPNRLYDSYGLEVDQDSEQLREAKQKLLAAYRSLGWRPALYYAIILFDGDDMGAHITACLEDNKPEQAHRVFSAKLTQFAGGVKRIVEGESQGRVVYNGGDDVLAVSPLVDALQIGQNLAAGFPDIVTGGSASAGIAIVHHTYPLSAALSAARRAERSAKGIPGKATVCVRVLKRSGEAYEMRSFWQIIGNKFSELVAMFTGDGSGDILASRFAYDAKGAAYGLPIAGDSWQSETKRLIKRHRNPQHPNAPDPAYWASALRTWAEALPALSTDELASWLVFARFVALHGGE